MAPVKIGVAGYMGSGKSTCAGFLSGRGGTVIDADSFAKNMMNSSAAIKKSLSENFGKEVVSGDRIEFSVLGEIVFRSLENLVRLNSIVHPPLLEQLHREITECDRKLCILDAALIPYWHIEEWFDRVYWIQASEDIRLKRLIDKTSLSPEKLKKRLRLQKDLFNEPSGSMWITISNEGTAREIKEIIDTSYHFHY